MSNQNNYWLNKNVFITGINGFIGGNLAKVLIESGANVFGLVRNHRRNSFLFHEKIDSKINFIYGDITDLLLMKRIISETRPDEIYNEAGVDHVSGDADFSDYAADITGAAVGRLLEMILQINPNPYNHRTTITWHRQNIYQNSREFSFDAHNIVGPLQLQALGTECL